MDVEMVQLDLDAESNEKNCSNTMDTLNVPDVDNPEPELSDEEEEEGGG
jgi:hypothetical protein